MSSQTAKILIVDDNEINLMLFERLLQEDGVEVHAVGSGAQAVELAESMDFAFILLDVQMPVMDGFETARAIRKLKPDNPPPIVFATAIHQDEDHVLRGYESGAVDYLFKPVDPQQLKSKVKVFLEVFRQRCRLEEEIEQKRRTEKALRRAEEKYRTIFENAVEGIFQCSPDGRLLEANPALARILGYDNPTHLISEVKDVGQEWFLTREERKNYLARLEKDGYLANYEMQIRRRDGSIIWISESSRLVRDPEGEVVYTEGLVEDITERKLSEIDLQHRATIDVLTGIPNRYLFFDRLSQALAHSARYGDQMAVMFLDLDGFKLINDTHGHQAGDEVLSEAASRIRRRIRASDTLGRLGGDEFGLILSKVRIPEDARRVAQDVVNSLKEPFEVGGEVCQVGVSVGVSCYPLDGDTPDTLLNRADSAMYFAKKAGGNRYVFVGDLKDEA
jgi:diguanylate cyclase (GGDEF)-like protein/PAS domain S-box-containing protein